MGGEQAGAPGSGCHLRAAACSEVQGGTLALPPLEGMLVVSLLSRGETLRVTPMAGGQEVVQFSVSRVTGSGLEFCV